MVGMELLSHARRGDLNSQNTAKPSNSTCCSLIEVGRGLLLLKQGSNYFAAKHRGRTRHAVAKGLGCLQLLNLRRRRGGDGRCFDGTALLAHHCTCHAHLGSRILPSAGHTQTGIRPETFTCIRLSEGKIIALDSPRAASYPNSFLTTMPSNTLLKIKIHTACAEA